MRRISVCAVLFLSSALGFGWQKPPYRGQTPFFARPMAIPGDASHQQEQSQNQGELREALRACAALLVAATSVSCPDAAQQKAQPQQQPPQPPANLQEKSGGNSQMQSDLRGSVRACAALLLAATSVPCPGDTAQGKAQPEQPPQPAANPQEKSGANSQFLSNLQSDLKSDPGLSGTDVEATVDDVKITLTGTVHSQAQLDRVMALTSPYAYYRKVVNNVTVK